MSERQLRGPEIPPFYAGVIGRHGTARAHSGLELLSMHFGQPTAGPPASAIAAAHKRLDQGSMGYYESEALRDRLSRHYDQAYSLEVAPERILLTAGASAVVSMA